MFFLILAVIIWVIAQFSKTYSEVVDIPVRYENVPLDKLLAPEQPAELKLMLSESGFTIAYYHLFPPTLTVDVSNAAVEDSVFVFSLEENRDAVQRQLGISYDRISFPDQELRIGFEQRAEKRLPVVPVIDLDFAAGYAALGDLRLDRDSITVSGPEAMLDTIVELRTELLEQSNIKNNLEGTLYIDTSMIQGVTLYQNQVTYQLEVDRFTEGRLEVPIELINVPAGQNVVIFPQQLMVSYRVSLENFNNVEASDFKIVCDFSQLRDGQDFLVPKVLVQPGIVENVRMNEKRISFIIKK